MDAHIEGCSYWHFKRRLFIHGLYRFARGASQTIHFSFSQLDEWSHVARVYRSPCRNVSAFCYTRERSQQYMLSIGKLLCNTAVADICCFYYGEIEQDTGIPLSFCTSSHKRAIPSFYSFCESICNIFYPPW